jgi:hypothetical protein
MSRRHAVLTVLLLAGVILAVGPSGLWATSAVPEPGNFGFFPINPNASGTKVSGPMSLAYDIVVDETCPTSQRVLNAFLVTTLQVGNSIKPFNRALDPPAPFCFGENTDAQVQLVTKLIDDEVMPFFFSGSKIEACVETSGVRPCWEVKSVTNFLPSGTGAMSLNITLAVH